MRKITQVSVAVSPAAQDSNGECYGPDILYYTALCDDGSAWTHTGGQKSWYPLPEMPQINLAFKHEYDFSKEG